MNSQEFFPHISSSLRIGLTIVSMVAHILSCAAPPPPPVPKVNVTWATVVDQAYTQRPTAKKVKNIQVSHELWTTSSRLPPLDRVEVTLAKTGVLADINGSEGNYDISVGPHKCQTRWSSIDKSDQAMHTDRVNQCQSELNSDQRVRLSKSTHYLTLVCSGEGVNGLVELHNITVSLSKALETPQAKEGETTTDKEVVPIWIERNQMKCGIIEKQHRFLTKDHMSYERAQLDGGHWIVWTRGMVTFGLSELSLGLVEPSVLDSAEEKLLVLADNAIRIEGVSEGQGIESGLAQAIYVKASRVAQRISPLKGAPQKSLNTLMVVDVNASSDHIESVIKMTRRFARP